MQELYIPELGEGDTEGTVVQLQVAIGSHVEHGQVLLEIETDKVTLEVSAEIAGRLDAWLVAPGSSVRAGQAYARFQPATVAASASDPAPVATTAADQHDSASASISRERENAVQPHAAVTPTSAPPPAAPQPDPLEQATPPIPRATAGLVAAGPSARREARELGVDLTQVTGTAPGGRITRPDVRAYARDRMHARETARVATAATPLPDLARFGPIRRAPLSRVQQATARNMTRAASIIPHAWVQHLADVTALETARRGLRQRQRADEAPLTMTALVCAALARTLSEFPGFNASFDDAGQTLVYREYLNLGVAVATPRGLVVPVIRAADTLDLAGLAAELQRLSAQARDNSLPPVAYQGGSFTVSNLGGFAVSGLQPIVNWPEVAILGVAATQETLQRRDGNIEQRLLLPLTLGFDHRVINGVDAAQFLSALGDRLGNPLQFGYAATAPR